MSTAHSRVELGGRHVPVRLQHRNGLGEGARARSSRQVSVSGTSGARWSTYSEMPPSNRNDSSVGGSCRLSVTLSVSPGTRNAVWRTRSSEFLGLEGRALA